MITSVLKIVQGWVKIRGATDDTLIGNSGSSLNANVTASALPSGAATSALQTTGNTSLSNIDGKLNSLGQNMMANSMPVVLASDQVTTPGVPNSQVLTVQLAEPQTYSACAAGFTMAANPTDVFTITGSNTKTVRVERISVSFTTTSGSAVRTTVRCIKRSTANTGGTSVNDDEVPHNSTNAGATATVLHYTANPTLGTQVGIVRANSTGVQNYGLQYTIEWDFRTGSIQPMILNGTSQVLAVNFNGLSITGSVVSINVMWTEV